MYVYDLLYSPWYNDVFRIVHKFEHKAFIGNESGDIQSQCGAEDAQYSKCYLEYHSCLEIAVGGMSEFIAYRSPILRCEAHKALCYCYGYDEFNPRTRCGPLKINKPDAMYNTLPFVTLYPFNQTEIKQTQNTFKRRYHVTLEFLSNLCDQCLFKGRKVSEFLDSLKSRLLNKARSSYKDFGNKMENLSKLHMKKLANNLYSNEIFNRIIAMIAYGYLTKCNNKVQKILMDQFQFEIYGDSSHGIMNILGKQEGMYILRAFIIIYYNLL